MLEGVFGWEITLWAEELIPVMSLLRTPPVPLFPQDYYYLRSGL